MSPDLLFAYNLYLIANCSNAKTFFMNFEPEFHQNSTRIPNAINQLN